MNSAKDLSRPTNGSRFFNRTFSRSCRKKQINSSRGIQTEHLERATARFFFRRPFFWLLILQNDYRSRSFSHHTNRLRLLELKGSPYGRRNGSFHAFG